MATSREQKETFLKLRDNRQCELSWQAFWRAWDGFIWVVIRRRLCFAPDLWDDAKSLTDAKLFRFIANFDESREVAPWLARVASSACEDIKKQAGNLPKTAGHPGASLSFDDEDFADWLSCQLTDPHTQDKEQRDDVWYAVEYALSCLAVDQRQKTAFLLYYHHGFKLREIASLFQLPPSRVNNWPGTILRKILPAVCRELTDLGYQTIPAAESTPPRRHSDG